MPSDPLTEQYLLGASDALDLPAAMVLDAAKRAHPGRVLTRQHVLAMVRHVQRARRRFAFENINAALIAADGGES